MHSLKRSNQYSYAVLTVSGKTLLMMHNSGFSTYLRRKILCRVYCMHGNCTVLRLKFNSCPDTVITLNSFCFIFSSSLGFFPLCLNLLDTEYQRKTADNSISARFLCFLDLHNTFTHRWMYSIPSLAKLIQENSCSAAV